jgi:LytS/YehU family sensor histidine kinase
VNTEKSLEPNEPDGDSEQTRRIRRLVVAGLFAALAQTLGSLRPIELNVEPKTLTIFLAGLLAGPQVGAMTGLVTSILHQLLHAKASSFLILAQAGLWALTGALGGLWSSRKMPSWTACLAGAAITLVYDLTMDTLGALAGNFSPMITIWQGFVLPPFFTPIHVVSNAVLFGIAVPQLEPRFQEFRKLFR